MNTMLALSFGQLLVTFLFLVTCFLLIIVVLLQKGRGGGLSGAFGGVGGHSAFGTKTGDVFTWVTVALTFLFILFAVLGNYIMIPPDPQAGPNAQILPAGAEGEAGEDFGMEQEDMGGSVEDTVPEAASESGEPADASGDSEPETE